MVSENAAFFPATILLTAMKDALLIGPTSEIKTLYVSVNVFSAER